MLARISLANSQLDTRTTRWGHTYSYSPKVLSFLEQLEIMQKAWTEDDFTYQGQHFNQGAPKPDGSTPGATG